MAAAAVRADVEPGPPCGAGLLADHARGCGEALNRNYFQKSTVPPLTALRRQCMMSDMKTTTLDLGNNEQLSRGIFPQADGTFLAMTFTRSKTFKTLAGAARWFKAVSK